MVLALKLILTPLMITLATLTGRRWGPVISGWLIGFPFTSGPVSLILAMQNGVPFASQAAIGILGGQLAVLIFCLTYSLLAPRFNWSVSVSCAIIAFFLITWVSNLFTLSLLPVSLLVILLTVLVIRLIPRTDLPPETLHPPKWDIPARILIATSFVFLLTTFADFLGPQLSGLIAPFPIYSIVLATFAQHQQGPHAARQLLRGVAFGSFAFISFFIVVAGLLPTFGLLWTYLLAAMVTLLVNGGSLVLTHRLVSPDSLF